MNHPSQKSDPPKPKPVASPISTGGGGADFERRVGAYYLAATLLQAVPRGLNAGIAQEVRFQRLYEGEPLDDLIVLTDLPAGEAKLALQLKRDLVFGEEDKTFDEVMAACWETFKSPRFNVGIDRFGVCLALYSKKIDEYYQSVLSWARNSANAADFLSRVSVKRLANETQRSFVQLVRSKLDAYYGANITDDELWNFLRSMVILRFDFLVEGGLDYPFTIELLKSLLPADKRAEASALFDKLEDYAAEGNSTAGSFNSITLREKLLAAGVQLLAAPSCRGDLERLNEHANFILGDIRTDIGGLELNRSPVVAAAQEALRTSHFLELIGPPGNGKSAIMKALISNQQGQGSVIVLAWDRIEGVGWNGFARDLQLERRLQEILLAASGSPQPTIFIDGPDRITDSGARKVIKDLLLVLQQLSANQGGSKRWKVVITAREENLDDFHSWFDWRILGQPSALRVPELSWEEVELVASQYPHLQSLLPLNHLEPIIKNLFMLDLLADRRMLPPSADALPGLATEVEVQGVWWERVIGSNDNEGRVRGRARQLALLEIGKQVVKAPGRRVVPQGIAADVLTSLEGDRILLRDARRDVYRFSHDLLEDWVLSRVLDQRRENLPTYIQKIGQPFGLLRAVQLLGCSVLEMNRDANEWVGLIRRVEDLSDLSPRWRQALYTAPLISTRGEELLDKAKELLLADDGRRLVDLLVVLRTLEVNPNFSVMPILEQISKEQNFISPLLLAQPVPRWNNWTPVVGWLVKNAGELPQEARPEAVRIFEAWQVQAPTGFPYRKEVGEIAFAWLNGLERWYDRRGV